MEKTKYILELLEERQSRCKWMSSGNFGVMAASILILRTSSSISFAANLLFFMAILVCSISALFWVVVLANYAGRKEMELFERLGIGLENTPHEESKKKLTAFERLFGFKDVDSERISDIAEFEVSVWTVIARATVLQVIGVSIFFTGLVIFGAKLLYRSYVGIGIA